jgi:hypothetical protein
MRERELLEQLDTYQNNDEPCKNNKAGPLIEPGLDAADPYKPRFIPTLGTLEGLDLGDLERRARGYLRDLCCSDRPELSAEEVDAAVNAIFANPDYCRYFIERQADCDHGSILGGQRDDCLA